MEEFVDIKISEKKHVWSMGKKVTKLLPTRTDLHVI